MERYSEERTENVLGRGEVYKISFTSEFAENTQILTTYTPGEKERLDNIAYRFYGDSSKWYVIARANKEVRGKFYAQPNKVLVIPRIT